jgi:hypothetical protein
LIASHLESEGKGECVQGGEKECKRERAWEWERAQERVWEQERERKRAHEREHGVKVELHLCLFVAAKINF